LKIGPILGILSMARANSNPFVGGQNESFTEIIEYAERMDCIAFVFSPFDIDWSKSAVMGYHFNRNTDEWERRACPLPTVIYNRIPNRTLENRADTAEVLALLRQKYGPRIFNPCFLDKWKTHKILSGNDGTKHFLPETRLLSSPETIAGMLGKHRSVFLKPSANSLGNEMFKVSKKGNRTFHFIHQTLNQEQREGLVSRCSQLVSELPSPEDTTGYLVQQFITLARFRDRPFDLRLLMQKNRAGKWQKTGIAARIAGDRSITTHVLYGGTRLPAEQVIMESSNTHGFSSSHVLNKLQEIQVSVPRAIEKGYRASFGELEMDVGIDKTGRVWFFEANSKPFRFDEKLIRAKSLVRLIHYVHYLDSKFYP